MGNVSNYEYLSRYAKHIAELIQKETGLEFPFENIFVEYSGNENVPVIQNNRNELYSSFDEEYIPPLFVIAAGVTMWSTDDYAGNMENIKVSGINIYSPMPLDPAIEIYRREDNVKIDNLQIDNIKLNDEDFEIEITEM